MRDIVERLHASVCRAVELLNTAPELSQYTEGREVRNILRQALADYADAFMDQSTNEADQRREMHADISDLAVLVTRLALALRKAQPEHSTVSDAAMEFLRKRGLDGEVLR